jgi:ABC-type antimicrobial peptide transport system permease subunit
MVLLAETNGESATVLAPLREMVRRMDAEVPLYDVQTMEVFYDARVTSIGNVIIRITGALGLMGITLTMVGLYGLVSYAVSRRTREIGIRIAVGASYGRVVGLMLRQGMAPAWFGLASGLVLSALTTRLLPALIPVNHQYDPQSFYLAMPILLVVTLMAAFIPARRAARVDPTIALRGD